MHKQDINHQQDEMFVNIIIPMMTLLCIFSEQENNDINEQQNIDSVSKQKDSFLKRSKIHFNLNKSAKLLLFGFWTYSISSFFKAIGTNAALSHSIDNNNFVNNLDLVLLEYGITQEYLKEESIVVTKNDYNGKILIQEKSKTHQGKSLLEVIQHSITGYINLNIGLTADFLELLNKTLIDSKSLTNYEKKQLNTKDDDRNIGINDISKIKKGLLTRTMRQIIGLQALIETPFSEVLNKDGLFNKSFNRAEYNLQQLTQLEDTIQDSAEDFLKWLLQMKYLTFLTK